MAAELFQQRKAEHATAQSDIGNRQAALRRIESHIAVLQRLVSDLREALDSVVDPIIRDHLTRRERANLDLERAVEVLTDASGVTSP